MRFSITKGITETELENRLKGASQRFGTFNDGRVNYKDADIAPIVMCTIVYKDKLLLVKEVTD